MELVLTGRRVDAAEARELGFVNRVVEGEGWLKAALELAGRSPSSRRSPRASPSRR